MNLTELKEYISTELKGCKGYEFIDRALARLDTAVAQHPTFMPDRFKVWFDSKNVKAKDMPLVFLTKCGYADIYKGDFDAKGGDMQTKTLLCIQDVFNDLRDYGIAVIPEDTIVIDYYENYIVAHNKMTLEGLMDWNKRAIEYLAFQGKTSTDFIKFFKTSKIMRGLELRYEEMDKKCNELKEEWEALLNSIPSVNAKQ